MKNRKRCEREFRRKLRQLDEELALRFVNQGGWGGSYIVRSRTGRIKFELVYRLTRMAEFLAGDHLVSELESMPGPAAQIFYLDLINEERAKNEGAYDPKKTLQEYERRVLVSRIIPLTTA